MLDFKVKKLDNIKFNYNELVDYYETVQKEYQHLKWSVGSNVDVKAHDVTKMYSWAIQTNLKDPTIPCPPYHIDDGNERIPNDDFSQATEMLFGVAKRLVSTLPYVRQTAIVAHPPGTRLGLHPDNDQFLKIHIPIKTNNRALFVFEDETFNLKEGSAYMINTTLLHGTDNQGDTDRVHLIFKFPITVAATILTTEYNI
jgi:hypothetical protein